MIFKNILFSALISGLFAGAFNGALQQFFVTPIIHQAEHYEVDHDSTAPHHHDAENHQWQPHDGLERVSYTYWANVLVSVSYSLLLITWMVFTSIAFNKPAPSYRLGIIYGLVGYLVFYAIISLSLPPELPGALSSNLGDRQIWWVMSVFCSVLGLSVLYLAPKPLLKGISVFIFIIPYLLIDDVSQVHGFYTTDSMAIKVLHLILNDYVISVTWVNLLYWLLLGFLSGGVSQFFFKTSDLKMQSKPNFG